MAASVRAAQDIKLLAVPNCAPRNANLFLDAKFCSVQPPAVYLSPYTVEIVA